MIRNRSSALMHTVNITKLNHICKSWLDAQSSTLRAHPARTWTHLRSRAIHWRNSSWQRSNESSPWWPRPHHQRIISVEKLPVKYLKFLRACVSRSLCWKENLATALKLRSWTYARYSDGWTFVLVSLNVDKTSTSNRERILCEEYKCWTCFDLSIVNRFNNWRQLFRKGDR